MLTEVCAFVCVAVNGVIECVTGAGAQNSGDSDRCDWVAVEPGRSVTVPPPPRPVEGRLPSSACTLPAEADGESDTMSSGMP